MRSVIATLRPSGRLPFARGLATAAEVPAATKEEAPAEAAAESSLAGRWTPFTKRTGVIARKRGMTALWDQNGRRWPVTVSQLDKVQVVRHSPPPANDKKGSHSLQIGASDRRPKTVTAQQLGHFRAAGVNPKYKSQEFRVTPNAVLPVGTELSAGHFVPGQYVDVTATSIGKGFQGVMKRHGFRGLKASHGVSLTHRSAGSTGQHQDPGRVLPGKKMAGHMGNVKKTQQNLLVHRVDLDSNSIFVRGCVPGVDDAFVSVRDSIKKVSYSAQKRFMDGKNQEEWIGGGVLSLPVPAGTVERAEKEGWPKVMEWAGKEQQE